MVHSLCHLCKQWLDPALLEATCFSPMDWAATSFSRLLCPLCKTADQAESKIWKSGHVSNWWWASDLTHHLNKAYTTISTQLIQRIPRLQSSKTFKCFSFFLLSLYFRHVHHPPALAKQWNISVRSANFRHSLPSESSMSLLPVQMQLRKKDRKL